MAVEALFHFTFAAKARERIGNKAIVHSRGLFEEMLGVLDVLGLLLQYLDELLLMFWQMDVFFGDLENRFLARTAPIILGKGRRHGGAERTSEKAAAFVLLQVCLLQADSTLESLGSRTKKMSEEHSIVY